MKPKRDFIAEFKMLYHEEFGELISDAEALERFTRLTNVLRAITTPNSGDSRESARDLPPSFDGGRGNDTLKP
jgi:hypothetical protein